MGQPKIATCCYCGTRAALVLRGDVRHELSCSACGAPLHDLKSLPADKVNRTPPAPLPAQSRAQQARPPRPKRRKRKSLSRRVLSEMIDLIEDILD